MSQLMKFQKTKGRGVMKRYVLLVLLVVAVSCSMSPRAKLVETRHSIGIVLATIDDSERIMCFGSVNLPADPTHCSTALAQTAGLTDEKHKKISEILIKAFDEQVKLGASIERWVPGDTIDMTAILGLASDAAKEVNELDPSIPDVSQLILDITKWQSELQLIWNLVKGQ